MRLKFFLIIVALITSPTSSWAKNYQVKMLNSFEGQSMLFVPGFLKIEKGDSVTFVPTNSGHNSQSVFTPKNAKSWSGKNNEEITINFSEEGIFIYQCSLHLVMGMVGVIEVGTPTNFEEAKDFAKNFRAKFAMNKDRLDKYLAQAE